MDGILGNVLENFQVWPRSDDDGRTGGSNTVPTILLEALPYLGHHEDDKPGLGVRFKLSPGVWPATHIPIKSY